jgi:DNA-binding transcriptional LysR family regulator
VSRQVRLLEKDLSVRLFDRTPSGMVLTAAGSEVLDHFVAAGENDEELRERLRGTSAAAVPVVRVGLLEGLVALVPALTGRLHRRSQRTRLDLVMLPSRQVVDAVVSGGLDMGFSSGRAVGRGVRAEATHHLRVHVVTGPDHLLAERSTLPLEDLDGLAVVLPDKTFGIRRELDKSCREHGVRMAILGETNTLALALELALARGAATLLTGPALPHDAARRGIRAIPVTDKRLQSVPVSLIVSRTPHRPDATRLAVRLGRDLLGNAAVRTWT